MWDGDEASTPPWGEARAHYDAAGNLIFDGRFFYQYDAWGRLVQVSRATQNYNANPGNLPTGPIPFDLDIDDQPIKQFSYDGLGRLIRAQSPYPDPDTTTGLNRTERFYYDGIRRIQEVVIDDVPSIVVAGESGNPGLENLANQLTEGGTGEEDGDASPGAFEQQLTLIGMEMSRLRERVRDADRWCSPRALPARASLCLRSTKLLVDLPADTSDALAMSRLDDLKWSTTCEAISRRRSLLLSDDGRDSKRQDADSAPLIVYCRSASFLCGLARESSDGYFGAEDDPPWDTWLCFGSFRGCIDARGQVQQEAVDGVLAFVPQSMLLLVQNGFKSTVGFGLLWAPIGL